MNKTQVIDAVAQKTGMKKKDAEGVVNAFLSTIEDALAAGEKVQLVGFGTFETKERAARTGRNPATNETIEIAASKHPAFTAGKALKEIVNK
ncbi:MAG: HU family DNA-binding protein [Clostridia bacterium]|nr:HU family DNA-binding protein [Clostridia bacterium]